MYVDVIVQRWQQCAGKTATLAGDGRTQFVLIDRLEQNTQKNPAAVDAGRAEQRRSSIG